MCGDTLPPFPEAVKHNIMAVMARLASGPRRSRGMPRSDDRRSRRGALQRQVGAFVLRLQASTPFVAAVSTSPEGRPRILKLAPVKGFCKRRVSRDAPSTG